MGDNSVGYVYILCSLKFVRYLFVDILVLFSLLYKHSLTRDYVARSFVWRTCYVNVLVVVCVCLEHSRAALTRVTDTAIQDERDSSFVSCVV